MAVIISPQDLKRLLKPGLANGLWLLVVSADVMTSKSWEGGFSDYSGTLVFHLIDSTYQCQYTYCKINSFWHEAEYTILSNRVELSFQSHVSRNGSHSQQHARHCMRNTRPHLRPTNPKAARTRSPTRPSPHPDPRFWYKPRRDVHTPRSLTWSPISMCHWD